MKLLQKLALGVALVGTVSSGAPVADVITVGAASTFIHATTQGESPRETQTVKYGYHSVDRDNGTSSLAFKTAVLAAADELFVRYIKTTTNPIAIQADGSLKYTAPTGSWTKVSGIPGVVAHPIVAASGSALPASDSSVYYTFENGNGMYVEVWKVEDRS